MTPTPFIRIFLENEEDILVDIDNKSREDIYHHLKKIICKTDEQLLEEAKQKQDNPANFGWGCKRQCMCEEIGQIPCPGAVPLPIHMRGKYKQKLADNELNYYLQNYPEKRNMKFSNRYTYKYLENDE